MYRFAITSRRIYERRQQLGYSLRQLAARSGVPRSSLSRYERGETLPTGKRLARIARALNTTTAYLAFEGKALPMGPVYLEFEA